MTPPPRAAESREEMGTYGRSPLEIMLDTAATAEKNAADWRNWRDRIYVGRSEYARSGWIMRQPESAKRKQVAWQAVAEFALAEALRMDADERLHDDGSHLASLIYRASRSIG